jgi:hypothetical protein
MEIVQYDMKIPCSSCPGFLRMFCRLFVDLGRGTMSGSD